MNCYFCSKITKGHITLNDIDMPCCPNCYNPQVRPQLFVSQKTIPELEKRLDIFKSYMSCVNHGKVQSYMVDLWFWLLKNTLGYYAQGTITIIFEVIIGDELKCDLNIFLDIFEKYQHSSG